MANRSIERPITIFIGVVAVVLIFTGTNAWGIVVSIAVSLVATWMLEVLVFHTTTDLPYPMLVLVLAFVWALVWSLTTARDSTSDDLSTTTTSSSGPAQQDIELRIDSIGPTSVDLAWTPGQQVARYRISTQGGLPSYAEYSSVNVFIEYTLEGLQPSTRYTILVVEELVNGDDGLSDSVEIKTDPIDPATGSVTTVSSGASTEVLDPIVPESELIFYDQATPIDTRLTIAALDYDGETLGTLSVRLDGAVCGSFSSIRPGDLVQVRSSSGGYDLLIVSISTALRLEVTPRPGTPGTGVECSVSAANVVPSSAPVATSTSG